MIRPSRRLARPRRYPRRCLRQHRRGRPRLSLPGLRTAAGRRASARTAAWVSAALGAAAGRRRAGRLGAASPAATQPATDRPSGAPRAAASGAARAPEASADASSTARCRPTQAGARDARIRAVVQRHDHQQHPRRQSGEDQDHDRGEQDPVVAVRARPAGDRGGPCQRQDHDDHRLRHDEHDQQLRQARLPAAQLRPDRSGERGRHEQHRDVDPSVANEHLKPHRDARQHVQQREDELDRGRPEASAAVVPRLRYVAPELCAGASGDIAHDEVRHPVGDAERHDDQRDHESGSEARAKHADERRAERVGVAAHCR